MQTEPRVAAGRLTNLGEAARIIQFALKVIW